MGSDEECLAVLQAKPRSRGGAEQALAALFERHDRRLQCHLRWRFGEAMQNDDLGEISQETWLRVWSRLDDRVRAGAFRSWLYRIGENLAIDLLRRKKVRNEAEWGQRDLPSPTPDHGHDLAFAEQLRRCVEKLPPGLREVVGRLMNLESSEEVAAAMDHKVSRVYQLKHQAKALLTECMELAS